MNLAEKPSLPRMEIQLVIWRAEIGLPHLMVVLESAQPPTPPKNPSNTSLLFALSDSSGGAGGQFSDARKARRMLEVLGTGFDGVFLATLGLVFEPLFGDVFSDATRKAAQKRPN